MFLLLMRMREGIGWIEWIEWIEWCCEEGRSNLIVPISDSGSVWSGVGVGVGEEEEEAQTRTVYHQDGGWAVYVPPSYENPRESRESSGIGLNRRTPSTHITSYLIEL